MTAGHVDADLLDREPEELPGAIRLLAAMEEIGWVSAQELPKWRGLVAALGVYQADPQLWIDGPEAWRLVEHTR